MSAHTHRITIKADDQGAANFLTELEGIAAANQTKQAGTSQGVKRLKNKLLENGWARRIIEPDPITQARLTYDGTGQELPYVTDEFEMDTPGAKAIPLIETMDTSFFWGKKFNTYIWKISTPKFWKSTDELLNYRHDPRDVLTERVLRDIETTEDGCLLDTVDETVGAEDDGAGTNVSAYSGLVQNRVVTTTDGHIDRPTYVESLADLKLQLVPPGARLINWITSDDFLRFDHDAFGGPQAAENFMKGMKAIPEAEILGQRHIFTIKTNMVPNGVVYEFAEQVYLGVFYILEDVCMWVKKEQDILHMQAYEKVGMSLPNPRGMARRRWTAES